jgi:hypothetical protein
MEHVACMSTLQIQSFCPKMLKGRYRSEDPRRRSEDNIKIDLDKTG